MLTDELTNQVTTECNGVLLYLKEIYFNKGNMHVKQNSFDIYFLDATQLL